MYMVHPHHDGNELIGQILLTLPFVLALFLYVYAVILTQRRYQKQWPIYRIVFWFTGIICTAVSVIGPLAQLAVVDFRAHMVTHLLLGMLAPLLLVLATPMTLILRTLPVSKARMVTRILKSRPLRILSNPLVAALLNVGGLWLLYTTDLYMLMHQNLAVHILVHMHVFLIGYLFTISIIYIDLTPHRTSFIFRSVVLLMALAGHAILSKYIYANPPAGIIKSQAEIGGMLMYYGGDAIEILLIVILCYQWFKSTKPREGLLQKQIISQ
ncbi:cytochrome c oxidase assembly protein [Paenisporosarcina quisquiliarum]|uniref:Cytochrome c oxidase assembly protein n=1 Tax=Paenisporosarcina quisquiliarum TaxID=365346 RepID=A0A9X3RCR5_9BACL|nr:cytochrome c oxidase assembly protein [Paenisporosarcina quisquiliarum]MCZ8537045.1 cytochrome c oxidase assembly protein [Paenisporosarcina quisquiliarum]